MSRSTCPKCQGAMEYVSQDGLPTATCGECGGAWIDIAEVEHLSYGVPAAHELVEVFTTLAARELPPADHACPGCAQPLLLASYGGVEVDIYWKDGRATCATLRAKVDGCHKLRPPKSQHIDGPTEIDLKAGQTHEVKFK